MFSVIIPLYNKEKYLEKCIHSVLSQSFGDFELIVVNDGSTDNSLAIVKQFSDERITIISQENLGVSIARNSGVKVAKYEFIAFLDADDWWDSHFLEEMNNLINVCPDAGLYGCKYYIVKNGRNLAAKIGINENFKVGYINYFKVYNSTFWVPINCSFVVIKKEIYNNVGGFKPQLKFGEDFDLWVRIALKYKVGYLNKCLAYSNQDVMSANRALGSGKLWKKEEYVTLNLSYLEPYEVENNDLKYLLDGLKLRSLVEFYLDNRYITEIKQILGKVSFKNHPLIFTFIYRFPKQLVLSYFLLKKTGSMTKQLLLKK